MVPAEAKPMMNLGLQLAERGMLPLPVLRMGIRHLLHQRLRELSREGSDDFADQLRHSAIAIDTDKANEQHYEVPAEFFQLVLGSHWKYSAAYWPSGVTTLDDAERASLEPVCERADLRDGQDVLELGCGWGSLSLFMAEHYPNSRILTVSNSHSQREFINGRKPANLDVATADVNVFEPDRQFDRIVSVEMFEHVRNYATLLQRIAGWLRDDGRLFVHVFCHRDHAYPFETEGAGNWMGRHFFTGGLMPSVELIPSFNDDVAVEQQWTLNGIHYQRTAAAWRINLERERDAVLRLFAEVYGADSAKQWYHRWRLFFLACEELFGFRGGDEWCVAHYRFAPTRARVTEPHTANAVVG
jgi:cyclopropane-fatty-acyl-phospholipid synthase